MQFTPENLLVRRIWFLHARVWNTAASLMQWSAYTLMPRNEFTGVLLSFVLLVLFPALFRRYNNNAAMGARTVQEPIL